MTLEHTGGSFLAVSTLAQRWKAENRGSVYLSGQKLDHYVPGLVGIVSGCILKLFGGKKYSTIADVILGGGLAAVIDDKDDMIKDYKNRQGIFKLLPKESTYNSL